MDIEKWNSLSEEEKKAIAKEQCQETLKPLGIFAKQATKQKPDMEICKKCFIQINKVLVKADPIVAKFWVSTLKTGGESLGIFVSRNNEYLGHYFKELGFPVLHTRRVNMTYANDAKKLKHRADFLAIVPKPPITPKTFILPTRPNPDIAKKTKTDTNIVQIASTTLKRSNSSPDLRKASNLEKHAMRAKTPRQNLQHMF